MVCRFSTPCLYSGHPSRQTTYETDKDMKICSPQSVEKSKAFASSFVCFLCRGLFVSWVVAIQITNIKLYILTSNLLCSWLFDIESDIWTNGQSPYLQVHGFTTSSDWYFEASFSFHTFRNCPSSGIQQSAWLYDLSWGMR